MKRTIKYITFFLILIVGFIIAFHSVIPHNYSYELKKEFPQHNHKNTTEKFNCHSFHEFDSNQISLNIIQHFLKDFPISGKYLFITDNKIVIPSTDLIFLKNINLPNNSFFTDISPTRGSPYFI